MFTTEKMEPTIVKNNSNSDIEVSEFYKKVGESSAEFLPGSKLIKKCSTIRSLRNKALSARVPKI